MRHPGQMEKLRAEPSGIKTAVEELLRYESPLATATERFAREDVAIAGVTIPRGELVYFRRSLKAWFQELVRIP